MPGTLSWVLEARETAGLPPESWSPAHPVAFSQARGWENATLLQSQVPSPCLSLLALVQSPAPSGYCFFLRPSLYSLSVGVVSSGIFPSSPGKETSRSDNKISIFCCSFCTGVRLGYVEACLAQRHACLFCNLLPIRPLGPQGAISGYFTLLQKSKQEFANAGKAVWYLHCS